MKILCVDVGTGTQDILLYDSDKEIENCLKTGDAFADAARGAARERGHACRRSDRPDRRHDGRRAVPLGRDGSCARRIQSLCHARSGAHV